MGLLMLASSTKPAQLMDMFFNQLLNFSIMSSQPMKGNRQSISLTSQRSQNLPSKTSSILATLNWQPQIIQMLAIQDQCIVGNQALTLTLKAPKE